MQVGSLVVRGWVVHVRMSQIRSAGHAWERVPLRGRKLEEQPPTTLWRLLFSLCSSAEWSSSLFSVLARGPLQRVKESVTDCISLGGVLCRRQRPLPRPLPRQAFLKSHLHGGFIWQIYWCIDLREFVSGCQGRSPVRFQRDLSKYYRKGAVFYYAVF